MGHGWRTLVSAFVASVALVPVAAASHNEPLVAQWHLDTAAGDSTPDSSGHLLDGTATDVALDPGRFGDSMTFPSDTAGVVVPNSSLLEPARPTLVAWVRRNGAAGPYEYVAAKGAQQPCQASSYGLYTGATGGLQFYITQGAGLNPVFSAEIDPALVWDDAWHGVAGVFDGDAVHIYLDGAEVGVGTPSPSAIGYGLSDGEFTIGRYPRQAPCASATRFTGAVDEVRLYDRALTSTELQGLLTAPGATPPVLPPDASPTPTPTPTPAPAPSSMPPPASSSGLGITAVSSATPVVAGRRALLHAAVIGTATRLEWDLTGDGKPEATCPGSQPTLGFRAPAGAAPRSVAFSGPVSVRAFDATGASVAFTETLSVSAAPATSVSGSSATALRRVADSVAKAVPLFTCGRAEDFGATKFELAPRPLGDPGFLAALAELQCTDRTILYGTLHITGCFAPIRSAAQLPAAELGSLKPLLDIGKPPKRADVIAGKDAPAGIFVERALDFTDAYFSRGPVLVNGAKLTPADNARVVVFPQVKRIFSSDAAMSVGGIRLAHPRAFSLSTVATGAGGRIPLGSFSRLSGGVRALGAFGLTGDVGVVLTPPSGPKPAGAELTAELKLPDFLRIDGVISAQGRVKLGLSADGALQLDDLTIGPIAAGIGPLGIQGLQLDYTSATREWRGMGSLCLTFACLDAREVPGEAPPGGVVIRDGELERIYANVSFPGPGITLFPGVQLNRIGAGIGLGPTRLLGGARLTAAGIFQIDGALALAFPSAAAPYSLTRQEVGNSFPAEFYTRRYTGVTMAVGADASLRVPLVGTVPLGGAYLLYSAPAYVAFGGGVSIDLLGIVDVNGRLDGEFNLANGRFNLAGQARVCIIDFICAGTVGRISSRGAGACVTVLDYGVDDVNVGGGVQFDPYNVIIWPLDGCRWTRFAERNVFGGRAAQAGEPITVTVKEGDPSQAVQLEGVSGAPRVRVTTPAGATLTSPDGPGVAATKVVRIVRSEQVKTTVVGLQDPTPGTYRIETLPDSPTITTVSAADDQPEAAITATVSGADASAAQSGPVTARAAADARRTIRYSIRKRADQRVTFVEVGPEGRRPIGTVDGGGRGTLTFSPSPGRSRRRIEAQFELAGLQAETITVANFQPPSPRLGRPARIRVVRRAARIRLSWARVPGATRYVVTVTADSGLQRQVRTAATAATIRGVPRGTGGTVSVHATAPERQGGLRRGRFRASGRRAPTRFGPLPRLAPIRKVRR